MYIVEPLRFSPEKKKKRCKTRSLDKVETVKPSDPPIPLTNGSIKCNGFHPALPAPPVHPALPAPPLLPPPPPPPTPPLPPPSVEEEVLLLPCPTTTTTTTESPSESSSCSSTHSEESYTSRLPPPSPLLPPGLCNGHSLSFPLQQPPRTKRSMKRRKSRQTELQFPSLPTGGVSSLPSLQTLIKGNKDISVGTIGVTAVTGHV